jgi:hypothetical protein
MKKTGLSILLCLSVFAAGPANGQSATQVSATGHVFAEVISVFSASEISELYFGKFSPGHQGGKLILSPEGTVSVMGSVYKGTGTHNAASFQVTGDIDIAYSITLPVTPVILTHVSGSKTISVGEWVSIPYAGTGTGRLQDGSQVVLVGATLNVGTLEDNPVGIYTGTYTISFDFN